MLSTDYFIGKLYQMIKKDHANLIKTPLENLKKKKKRECYPTLLMSQYIIGRKKK